MRCALLRGLQGAAKGEMQAAGSHVLLPLAAHKQAGAGTFEKDRVRVDEDDMMEL